MKTKLWAVLIIALLSIVGVQATYEDHPVMELTNKIIGCRVDMSNELIEDYIDKVPQTEEDLGEYADILSEDKNTLDEYNNEGNWRDFFAYRLDTYVPHQLDAFKDVIGVWFKFAGWNVSQETKDELKENGNASKAVFEECNFQSLKTFADYRSETYETSRQLWQDKLDELKDKNPDIITDGMQQVLNDADVFQEEYDGEVEDAETSIEMFEAIGGHCLFNGCPMGKNFHFAAKFGLAKMEAILALISPDAIEADLEDLVEEAQNYLDAASEALDEVGTDNFTFKTRDDVWDNLRDANAKIKEIVGVLSPDPTVAK